MSGRPDNAINDANGAIAQSLIDQFARAGLPAQVSIRGDQLHIGLWTADAPTPEPATQTLRQLLQHLDLAALGLSNLSRVHVYGLPAPKQAAWRREFAIAPLTAADTDLAAFDNRFSAVVYFPLALLLGILLKAFGPFGILLRGIDIWFHEFGHAVVAWMAGRRAIPLPIGFTPVNPERSLVVYGCVLTLLGLLFWAGQREQKRWPQVLAGSLAVVQFAMTWLMSANTFDWLLYFGGIGGEFLICALLMVSYYFPFPAYFQWGLYRYPVVVGAAFTFFGSLWNWRQVRRGLQDIPWGSMWGGDGDMEQLAYGHGWSQQRIIDTYNALGTICLSAIVAVYVHQLVTRHRGWLVAQWRQFVVRG